jgi:hypothetical protein
MLNTIVLCFIIFFYIARYDDDNVGLIMSIFCVMMIALDILMTELVPFREEYNFFRQRQFYV